jgi:POT family proton-dependent oligopeptide transporter
MLIGLVAFARGRPLLMGRGEPPDPERLASPVLGMKFERVIYLVSILAVGLVWFLLQYQKVVGALLGVAGLALIAFVLHTAVFRLPKEDRDRIIAALYLIVAQIPFWALFEQAGSSLNLFTDRSVDRHLFGWNVPASMFQSINAIYIVALGPVFAWLWIWLGRRKLEPSAPTKFALGVMQVGLGFLVLVAGARAVGAGNLTPVIFIFLIYLIHTTGELCLSPVGLSAMNRLSPAHMASLIMGAWFFASATGNFAAGLISAATGGEGAGPENVLAVYTRVGWLAAGLGVAMLAIAPLIRRLMHLETLRDVEAATVIRPPVPPAD